MNNVLYEALPEEWNGYHINTGFHIGVQLSLLMEDETLNDRVRTNILFQLLFGDEDGNISDVPETMEEIEECLAWFLGGWNHDNNPEEQETHERIMDYDVDQGRIYADFMQIYGIDLENTEMHWWKFQWLLWNMPENLSSFKQAIQIRTQKPRKGASAEERKAILKGKQIYGLKQKKKKYSQEEMQAINEFDKFMANAKSK